MGGLVEPSVCQWLGCHARISGTEGFFWDHPRADWSGSHQFRATGPPPGLCADACVPTRTSKCTQALAQALSAPTLVPTGPARVISAQQGPPARLCADACVPTHSPKCMQAL